MPGRPGLNPFGVMIVLLIASTGLLAGVCTSAFLLSVTDPSNTEAVRFTAQLVLATMAG